MNDDGGGDRVMMMTLGARSLAIFVTRHKLTHLLLLLDWRCFGFYVICTSKSVCVRREEGHFHFVGSPRDDRFVFSARFHLSVHPKYMHVTRTPYATATITDALMIVSASERSISEFFFRQFVGSVQYTRTHVYAVSKTNSSINDSNTRFELIRDAFWRVL